MNALSLKPGDWTPTGWGAQHRVRRSDEQWTELVCHTTIQIPDPRQPGPTQRCETARIDRDADERNRCYRCGSLPDLGPLRYGPLGEVRRSPEGLVAVCHRGRIGDGDRRWKVIGDDPVPALHGWRDDWDVAQFPVIGNVFELSGEASAA